MLASAPGVQEEIDAGKETKMFKTCCCLKQCLQTVQNRKILVMAGFTFLTAVNTLVMAGNTLVMAANTFVMAGAPELLRAHRSLKMVAT